MALAFASALGAATQAKADVNDGCLLTSSTVATCTGDVGDGVNIDNADTTFGAVRTLIVQDLTSDIGVNGVLFRYFGSDGSPLQSAGSTGGDLSATLALAPYAINGDAYGLLVTSTGGSGGNGSRDSGGNATGGTGGAGGPGGTVDIVLKGGGFNSDAGNEGEAIIALSQGGNGGTGGDASSGTFGNGYGGVGGQGGAGQSVTLTADSDAVEISADGNNSTGISLKSLGGMGGTGGEGFSQRTIARGGTGGNGGAGGDVSISITETGSTIATFGDDSDAIAVESHGGTGGTGGKGRVAIGGDAYGGNGGQGGAGGTIAVDVNATLSTLGNSSQGIFARSYGGNGGDGGEADGGRGTGGAAFGGGASGAVSVTFGGSITTIGDEANAIIAQSVGGFSGNAGTSIGFIAYGANSESGGGGGDVSVAIDPGTTIETSGGSADGLFAQSQGGGGGKGSTLVAVKTLGGSGNAGGDAGTVTVTSRGDRIATSGERSRALHATANGGTGGDGGNSYGIISIGSDAGEGGAGGTVTVTNTATLATTGDLSDALFASSVSDGGGSGHSTVGIAAIGGAGGAGGAGGDVSVFHSGGDISTTGKSADGVFIQSTGGGGGDASGAYAISAFFSVAIGGSGGVAANGGGVVFDDGGAGGYSISTQGDDSYGIFAQSKGGGGGRSGDAVSGSIAPFFAVSVGASGDGGHGGDGGDVTVKASGDVSTSGAHSAAIHAQSTGNGGGTVGTTVSVAVSVPLPESAGASVALGGSGGAGGDGGMVTVDSTGNLSTEGENAHGILAQSTGGGGGLGGMTLGLGLNTTATVVVGSSGGGGGDGSSVLVTGSGDITTGGANSKGILALSTGGGGGNAGMTIGGSETVNTLQVAVAVGGSGGTAGNGSDVTVDYGGDITTAGANAIGIHAQSQAKGGGNANVVIAAEVGGQFDAAVAVGGSGGAAGSTGPVDVTSAGAIITGGVNADGIVAESIGGSGGHARATASSVIGFPTAMSPSVSVGGFGGSGGASGDVSVVNTGTVATTGYGSRALVAKSQGGSGGTGGFAAATNLFSAGQLLIAAGGGGGTGNTSGKASVRNDGKLSTAGDDSSAIVVTTQGGDGGDAGTALTGSLSITPVPLETSSTVFSVTVGGGGGDGNTAGMASVVNTGDILTSGHSSLGIDAQSVGGSGGRGGAAISGNLSISTIDSAVVASGGITVGGDGGTGNPGGDVTVTNSGNITTEGVFSNAVNAISTGGDGGRGGTSVLVAVDIAAQKALGAVDLGIAIGGSGGSGNHGGIVTVENSGILRTLSNGSAGIYGQSVGGGGGVGGSANSVIVNRSNPALGDQEALSVSLTYTMGGSGGTGGDGGAVSITNDETISTEGIGSKGVFAQSVGGGGGDGGLAGALTLQTTFTTCTVSILCQAAADKDSANLEVSVGGSGGASGDGGPVVVDNSGSISTTGSSSPAIFAQSIGAGGGTGGDGEIGIGQWLTGIQSKALAGFLEGVEATGGAVYSATKFYKSAKIAIGGSGGASGDGGDVTVTNGNAIETSGSSAHAILAQSFGGGGGVGGDASNAVLSLFTLAGDGTASGAGGTVTVSSPGAISTSGDYAMGIVAQSGGGGGGLAGKAGSGISDDYGSNAILLFFPLDPEITGKDPSSRGGGDVVVETAGSIVTSGVSAHGIFAQSIGGGGGARELSTEDFEDADKRGAIGSIGRYGNAGTVTVRALGDISVSGENAVAIFAQSAAGAYGSSDKILIEVGGDISATGAGSRAIIASSSYFFPSNDEDQQPGIDIEVSEGASIRSGPLSSETIALYFGGTNTLNNYGVVESADPDAYVLRFDREFGTLVIENHGTLNGSMSLYQSDSHKITNEVSGVLGLGTNFTIGEGSVINNGTVSAATVGTIGQSTVHLETLDQTDSGTFWVDFDPNDGSPLADNIFLVRSGTSAVLAGGITGNIVSDNLVRSGESGSMEVLLATGGTIDVTGLSAVSTPAVTYLYEKTETSEGVDEAIVLSYEIDYTAPNADIGNGHRAFGSYVSDAVDGRFDEIAAGVGDDYAWVEDIAGQILDARTADAYRSFTPDLYFAPIATGLTSNRVFGGQLLSCSSTGVGGLADFADQGECRWFQGGGRATDRDGASGYASYSENAYALSGGFQTEIRDGLFTGLAASYEYATLDGNLSSGGTVNRLQIGGVLKREIDAWTVSGALSGGLAFNDLSREVLAPTGSVYAASSPQAQFVSVGGLATYEADFGGFYLKPSLGAGVAYLHQNGFTETGAGIYNYDVSAADVVQYWANPALEIGTDIARDGHAMRAYVRAGLAAIGTSGDDITASFAVDPAGTGFTISDDPPDLLADLSIGLDAQIGGRTTLRLEGNAMLGDDYASYGGSAKIRFGF